MTDHLWTRLGDALYGEHPWDDFVAYSHIRTRLSVVTTPDDFDGLATWFIDGANATAHYVGGNCGAYVVGDFMVADLGPVDHDWAFTYTWSSYR